MASQEDMAKTGASGRSKRTGLSKQDQQKIDYIKGPLEEGNHIMMTIHGSPLTSAQNVALSGLSRGRPPHVGIVPDGVILIIITPLNAVVHTSPTEDSENARFFSQRNFFKTGLPTPTGAVGIGGPPELTAQNGCYGASRFVPSFANERVVTQEEIAEKEEQQQKEEEKALQTGPVGKKSIRTTSPGAGEDG